MPQNPPWPFVTPKYLWRVRGSFVMEKSLDEIIAGKGPEARGSRRGGRNRRDSRRGTGRRGPIKTRSSEGGNCVLITNLNNNISEDDLLALFRSAGPITTVSLEREASKRTGVAWVLYEYAADAGVAVGRYHNRSAAGQIIQVRQVERVGDLSSQSSIKDRLGGSGNKKNQRSKGRGAKKQPKTQEELDAELDSYMAVDADAPTSATAPQDAAPAPAAAPADDLMIE